MFSVSQDRRVWAIGIYTGDSPLSLSPHPAIENPVVTCGDVTDIEAEFVADPFMVEEHGTWFMFFEALNRATSKGEVGLAVSSDRFHWEYRQIVLKEPFHLSYPNVFKWQDDHYMIPETLGANYISLYKARDFPAHWELAGRLIEGTHADPSIFYFDHRWWMFTCSAHYSHDTLNLYFADDLMGRWYEHPRSPIVKGDRRRARPGGRMTNWEGRLIRFAQDCYPRYGTQLRAFEITELTTCSYREEETTRSPILFRAAHGWNSAGMHHADPHLTVRGDWIACVDGCSTAMFDREVDSADSAVPL
jgi:hypothetical protein